MDPALSDRSPWRLVALGACVAVSMWLFFSPQPVGARSAPGIVDVLAHVAVFAVLTALAVWCFAATAPVVVTLLAYAVVTEAVQSLLDNGRDASLLDVLCDMLGIALALARRATQWSRSSKITT